MPANGFPVVTAGNAIVVQIRVQDGSGTTDPAYTGTAEFSSSDAYAILPGNSMFTLGFSTATLTLSIAGTQTVTADDTVKTSITGTLTLVVTGDAGRTTHFAVVAPATVTAGGAFALTVSALDAFNAVATSYAGTVIFASTDTAAVLPANDTLVSGVATFSATLKTSGARTISVSDVPGHTGISGSINVVPSAATSFSLVAPTSMTAGVAFALTVFARDVYNNIATSYAGTVHFTASGSTVTLPANSTLTAGAGVFAATLRAPASSTGNSRSVTATDTVTASITGSCGVTLYAAPTHTLALIGVGATDTAGAADVFGVTPRDAFNNTQSNYAGSVAFTSSDTAAVLPATALWTSTLATYTLTLMTTGTRTVTATDTITVSITGTSTVVVV